MQEVFEAVAKRLVSKNPDSDEMLAMVNELHIVEMDIPIRQQRTALRNVALAYNLKIPEFLK